jgi:hypothetical protein
MKPEFGVALRQSLTLEQASSSNVLLNIMYSLYSNRVLRIFSSILFLKWCKTETLQGETPLLLYSKFATINETSYNTSHPLSTP